MFLRDPLWLLLLLIFPAVVAAFVRRRQFGSLRFPSLRHFAGRKRSLRLSLLPLLPLLRVGGIALLIVALARPQKGTEIHQDFSKGVAIMMAMDISGSMRAMDFALDNERASRLDAVKSVFSSFVMGDDKTDGLPGRPYDEIGVVAFGGFAVSRAPLTLDHGALMDMLEQIRIPKPIVDRNGRTLNEEEYMTAIGDGLALSVARLKESVALSKVIILLSDGRNNAGEIDPEAAARTAKEFAIKVYTIGIGQRGRAPVPVIDPKSGEPVIDPTSGKPYLQAANVDFDPETLRSIAEITGGSYFHATKTEALKEIYAAIDRMEKTEIESRVFMRFNEFFGRYLWIGLGLLLAETFVAHTILRRLP